MRILLSITDEIKSWLEALISAMPGRIGENTRRCYYTALGCRIGARTRLLRGVTISCPSKVLIGKGCTIGIDNRITGNQDSTVTLGDNVATNQDCIINARGGGKIEIGDSVLLGPRVTLRSNNHRFGDPQLPVSEQGHAMGSIFIGSGAWLGSHVVVLANVRIGEKSVIGAGAIVSRDIPELSVAVGVPARVIRQR